MLGTDAPLGAVRGRPLGAAAQTEAANKETNRSRDFLLVSPRVGFCVKQHCVNKDFNKATLMDCLSLSVCPSFPAWWAERLERFAADVSRLFPR